MKSLYRLLNLGLLAAATCQAGQVYGSVRDANGKPVAGAAITIVTPAKTTYTGKTGADGSFQVFVKETGKCEFRLDLGGKTPLTATVFSYDEPARYQFEAANNVLKTK